MRLCVDFKVSLNLVIQSEHYPLPKPEDIFASLAGSQVFTVLDLSNAYQQLAVLGMSQQLLTVNTHLGLYRFTPLPFGISAAPAIFQSVMDRILKGLPKVCCYLDDVLIGGKDLTENQAIVSGELARLHEANVKINSRKCVWFSESVMYLGHRIDKEGIHPTDEKVVAIQEAPRPENIKQLQAFLGLLNFYNRFLPKLSSELRPLHHLLEKGVEWNWTENCESSFKAGKQLLLDNSLLVHYDPSKPIVVTCDASPYGVGAVLSHVINHRERPVSLASATLNSAERNYALIEKEAMAVIFAVRRYHKYLFGQAFTLVKDHQPLMAILGSKKGVPALAAARLQRWAIILSAYNYTIVYRKGSEEAAADAMSRLPLQKSFTGDTQFRFLGSFMSIASPVNHLQSEIVKGQDLPLTSKDLARATAKDPVLSKVLELTLSGWPHHLADVGLQPYFQRRQELSVDSKIVTWGNRVVIIPKSLRVLVLNL